MAQKTIGEVIATLEAGLGQGEASVEYDDFKATYRNPEQIQQALAYFRAKKREASGGKSGIQVSYGSFNRAG